MHSNVQNEFSDPKNLQIDSPLIRIYSHVHILSYRYNKYVVNRSTSGGVLTLRLKLDPLIFDISWSLGPLFFEYGLALLSSTQFLCWNDFCKKCHFKIFLPYKKIYFLQKSLQHRNWVELSNAKPYSKTRGPKLPKYVEKRGGPA